VHDEWWYGRTLGTNEMTAAEHQIVRIGCGAGFWGDSAEGPRQLVNSGQVDYLMLDYLAEITMSLLARARAKEKSFGYATDFVDVMAELGGEIRKRGIKVVTNAGGVNPLACRAAIEQRLRTQGIELKVAVILGDDLLDLASALREQGVREMFDGSELPSSAWSINAYLGAFPIAAALRAGADVVLTGRCVDSALALGPLIHEFGWDANSYDRLAAGSLVGHIIECGVQATGGIVTDWRKSVDDWDRMGFPIAECRSDGSFVITKPSGTGGRVDTAGVAEQIVYEIGDPAAYVLPDVICDLCDVTLRMSDIDRVEVHGVRGRAPTDSYKVSATFHDGFRAVMTMMIVGVDAARKAQRVGEAILKRTRRMFLERQLGDYRRTDIEVLGARANRGMDPMCSDATEVVLKVAVHHDAREAVELFSRECIPAATSMAQGLTGFAGGRPVPTPLVRLLSFLIPKTSVSVQLDLNGERTACCDGSGAESNAREADRAPTRFVTEAHEVALAHGEEECNVADAHPDGQLATVPLLALAYGRSGDKGDIANIGVFARQPELLPILRSQLTAKRVRSYFSHFVKGRVERFELPGLLGFNFVLHNALAGGGVASLRHDPQGKALAQLLMEMPMRVPARLLERAPRGEASQ